MENNLTFPDTPKYKGVRKRKWGKWVSEIRLPNSRDRIWLGSYDSPEKAARAFDAAQFCLRGPNANFNFPDNPPHIPGGCSMSPDEIRAAAVRFANMSVDNNVHVEESVSSVSDCGTTSSTAQIECGGVGIESSFYEQLSLCSNGFDTSDFGLFADFGDFNSTNYFSPEMDNNNNNNNNTNNINYDYYDNNEDQYDSSVYQDPYLWNF